MNTIIRIGIGIVVLIIGFVTAIIYDSLLVYWLTIFCAIALLIVIARISEHLQSYLGVFLGELQTNNNYRWYLLVIIAMVFSVSAFVAGFGEPVFTRDVVRPVITGTAESSTWGNVKFYLVEDDQKPATENAKTPTILKVKKYHSWYHIKFAIFLWLCVFVYMFFAFIDEAREAFKEAVASVKETVGGFKHEHGHTRIVVMSATDGTKVSSDGGETSADFFKKNLGKMFSIEIIADFASKFFGKVAKTIFGK